MVIYRKIEITIETQRLVSIRRRQSLRAWCAECRGEVEMVSLAGALAVLTQVPPDSPEAQKWHFSEGEDGTLLVCLKSMLTSL